MEKVPVSLVNTTDRSYDIFLGSNLFGEIKKFLSNKSYSKKLLIVSDSNVYPLYGEKVLNFFAECGFNPVAYVANAGEGAKSFAEAEKIYTKAIEENLDRKSLIIALGGGVIGDLAGFIAATYLRGAPFIQMPTSLLAAVDSSVGGKVAVNHKLGKNLIGAFYQPDAVFIDMDFLKTLPEREIKTGFGEIVKYGIIRDAEFIDFLEENAENLLKVSEEKYVKIIRESVTIKADVVSKDEKEGGLRRILNFGHTIGHAVEKVTNFNTYNHGEAVAIGMVAAMKMGEFLNLVEKKDCDRIENLLEKLKLPTRTENLSIDAIKESMLHDKKTVNGKIHFVLPTKIGEVTIKNDVPDAVIDKSVKYIIG